MTETLKALIPPGSEMAWPEDKSDIERIMQCTIVGEPTFTTTDDGTLMTVEAIRLSNAHDPI